MLTSIFKIVSKLPLRHAYPIARCVTWILHNIAHYRLGVVRENLSTCFPEKSKEEIEEIADKYYQFLGEYFIETIAMASMPKDEMMRRMRFENVEAVEEALKKGQDVSLLLGHYCNWEWCSSIPLHINTPCHPLQIYHPLRNKDADEAFLMLRGQYGATSVAMSDTLRSILTARREGVPTITGYIADQSPFYGSMHLFVDFLHHDTPVLTGAEKISRKLKAAVFYCDMHREKRGEYVCRYVEISPDASKEDQFRITRRYWELLENSIKRNPPYWLWSHRRWKRTREGMVTVYGKDGMESRLKTL